ncbi:helix-turn-helix domain-containing protein [Paenibacillus sp. GCM10027626]|uniref:AraC family transcriptional regulator n=1 Tax=Paenibacillus sp. GCM10027626 TaxID=3273411 RepID=UPI00363A67FD
MLVSYDFEAGSGMTKHVCRLESAGRGQAEDVAASLQTKHSSGCLFLFLYSPSGRGTFTCGTETHSLPEQHGCFVVVADPADFRLLPSGGAKPPELLWLLASGDPVRGFWEHFVRMMGIVCPMKRDEAPIRLLERLYRSLSDQSDSRYRFSLRLYEWLLAVEQLAETRNRLVQPVPSKLQQIVHQMESRVHDPLDLGELAAKAGLSKHHFCKMFKRHTGETPIHYMRKIRVKEAARLLRQSDLPIARIAEITGFDNLSYFGKVFRRLTGMAPTDFRKDGVDF